MEREPILTSPTHRHIPKSPQSPTLCEITPESPRSLTHQSAFQENEDQFPDPISNSQRKINLLRRWKTASAMTVIGNINPDMPKAQLESNPIQALILLCIYLFIGIMVYVFYPESFSGNKTIGVVDAIYFSIVTLSSVGYGDIVPTTPAMKVFCCLFVLVGFGCISSLLRRVMNYVWDLQETMILNRLRVDKRVEKGDRNFVTNYIVNVEEGRMRTPMKVGLALSVLIFFIGTGSLVLYVVEKLNWVDSIYLSVISVTTVGYRDRSFKTLLGRLFASLWLLVSTIAVAQAFLYLREVRIDKRHKRITNWILHRDMTVEDLFGADVNNNGFISKSDYVIYKLKELGKIGENDIQIICNQFDKLDPNNSGKITITDLLGNLDDRKEGRHGQASL